MSDLKAIVVAHIQENGDMYYHIYGTVRVFTVDERVPNDRVYEHLLRSTDEMIGKIIGDSTVGSSEDSRHAALKHKIEAFMDDAPALSVVPKEPEDE
jgi:hypothetical protein